MTVAANGLSVCGGEQMEPEYSGFCRGCNGYSEHLMIRPVRNNLTGTLEIGTFCPECRTRFGLFPYDKDEVERTQCPGDKIKGEQASGR